MIAGVVRYDQHKLVGRLQDCAALFDRQYAPIVGQRVDQHDRVLARLDYFVKVTNRTVFDCRRERPVVPDCFVAFEQEAAYEIGCRQVFVACDGDQRAIQAPGHILDEASLAAARRPFQHDGKLASIGRFK